jgi:hypothetical protein
MRVERRMFHCVACQDEFLAEILLDAPVDVALAAMGAVRCPKCGAGSNKVAFGRGFVPSPEPAPSAMTDLERRAAWLDTHDNGLSSEVMADTMCGLPLGNRWRTYPRDGDDFGRCERLLLRYPVWRARLEIMRGVSVVWNALVERWDEIAEAWRADVALYESIRHLPPAKQRKVEGWQCYDLMRSIIKPVENEGRLA